MSGLILWIGAGVVAVIIVATPFGKCGAKERKGPHPGDRATMLTGQMVTGYGSGNASGGTSIWPEGVTTIEVGRPAGNALQMMRTRG